MGCGNSVVASPDGRHPPSGGPLKGTTPKQTDCNVFSVRLRSRTPGLTRMGAASACKLRICDVEVGGDCGAAVETLTCCALRREATVDVCPAWRGCPKGERRGLCAAPWVAPPLSCAAAVIRPKCRYFIGACPASMRPFADARALPHCMRAVSLRYFCSSAC